MRSSISKCISIIKNNKLFSIIFFVTTAISMLFFNYCFDLPLTVWQSDDLLTNLFNGHFLNYYSYIIELADSGRYEILGESAQACYANYNILAYLALAIWILPLRLFCTLFGIKYSVFALSVWCKILFFIIELLVAAKLYSISLLMFNDEEKSRFVVKLYLSSVMLNYAIYLFGQFDILYVLIALIAVEAFLKDKMNKFCIVMGIAICFKGFAIFVLVPMLLLKEKRIIYLIKYLIESMLALIVWTLTFGLQEGNRYTQEVMSGIYDFKNRLFDVTTINGASVFILFAIAICVTSYYIKWSDNTKRTFYLLVLALLLDFNLFVYDQHPQWWMMSIPFICIAIADIADSCLATLLYAGVSISYIAYYCFWAAGRVDNTMIENGILQFFFDGDNRTVYTLSSIMSKFYLSLSVTYTVLLTFLVMIIFIALYENIKRSKRLAIEIHDEKQHLFFKRYGGVAIQFIITWGFIGLSLVEYLYGFK